MPHGKSIPIQLTSSDTQIKNVKTIIQQKEGIDVYHQCITLNGKRLEDRDMLKDFESTQKDLTLQLELISEYRPT